MNFKSNEELIARINGPFKTYQSTGLIDEGDYYRWIKEIVTKLNIPAYSPVHSVVHMRGNSIELPDDMVTLWAIWRYYSKSLLTGEKHPQRRTIWKTDEMRSLSDRCDDQIYIENNDLIVLEEFIQESPITHRLVNGNPIKIVKQSMSYCGEDSPALRSNTRLTGVINNNKISFNFEDGALYLQYFTLPKDEFGPMIPDVTEIELAIETYIIWKNFQQLYYSGLEDVVQRMKEAELQHKLAYREALSWVRLTTARGLLEYNERSKRKNNIFELKHSRE